MLLAYKTVTNALEYAFTAALIQQPTNCPKHELPQPPTLLASLMISFLIHLKLQKKKHLTYSAVSVNLPWAVVV